jgi:sulfur reductase FeS subunit
MTHYAMVIDLNTCVGCNACMAACAIQNQTPVWADKWRTYVHDQHVGIGENVQRRFFPRLCNHCTNPPCMTVCPTGATYKMDNGIVKVDPDRCMGCMACAVACPYSARYPATSSDIHAGEEFYGKAYLKRTRPSADKCDFCYDRVKQGLNPACVETCVGYARMFGDLDDPEDHVTKLVASGMAQPIMAHLGTGPNVFYIENRKRSYSIEETA